MKTTSLPQSGVKLSLILLLIGLQLYEWSAFAQDQAGAGESFEGVWKWDFTMPNGTKSKPRLFLYAEDGIIKGTTSFRVGNEHAITNASLTNGRLTFQVARRKGEELAITTYEGAISGTKIHGTITTVTRLGNTVFDWTAEKANEGMEGNWSWQQTVPGGRQTTFRVSFRQEGERLIGKVLGRAARLIRIRHGVMKGTDVSFEIETIAPQNRVSTKYSGKLTGDRLKGTRENTVNGKPVTIPWEATRSF